MRKLLSIIFLSSFSILSAVTVWKDGDRVLVRSKFSPRQDLVVEIFRYANENAWLIAPQKKITEYKSGILLHTGIDDFAAANVGHYNFLSGNHGSPFSRKLTAPAHGFTAKDVGKIFLDSRRHQYCLIRVIDPNTLQIHPVMTGNSKMPGFIAHSKDKLFCDGKEVKFTSSTTAQLYPSNRLTRYEFLIDGKTPLPEKQETTCRFLDLRIAFDVVSPGDLINAIKNNPGKAILPDATPHSYMLLPDAPRTKTYDAVPALLHYDVTIRHEERGASVIYRNMEVRQPVSSLQGMDVMFIWSGRFATTANQEFYIPKVKPVKLYGFGKDYGYFDFEKVVKFPKNLRVNCHLHKNYYRDHRNPPDRFIRLSGNGKREFGIALGYSLINGLSSQADWAQKRPSAYYFYQSSKMYPRIYDISNLPAGYKLFTVAYKQYFDPAAEPDATSMYCHYEYDDLLVYLDFHKKLKNKRISLPSDAVGRTISIVEKTPELRLHNAKKLDKPEIMLDNNAVHGYIVLKLTGKPQKGY